jgi:hypothetical protein
MEVYLLSFLTLEVEGGKGWELGFLCIHWKERWLRLWLILRIDNLLPVQVVELTYTWQKVKSFRFKHKHTTK